MGMLLLELKETSGTRSKGGRDRNDVGTEHKRLECGAWNSEAA